MIIGIYRVIIVISPILSSTIELDISNCSSPVLCHNVLLIPICLLSLSPFFPFFPFFFLLLLLPFLISALFSSTFSPSPLPRSSLLLLVPRFLGVFSLPSPSYLSCVPILPPPPQSLFADL